MKELKEKSTPDLQKALATRREELRDARFNVSVGQLKQVRSIRVMRKGIAQILTVMNSKRAKRTQV